MASINYSMKPTPEKYLQWLEEGRTFEDIRKDLTSFGKSEEEITEWTNLINRLAIRKTVDKEDKKTYLWMLVIGGLLFFVGLYTMFISEELRDIFEIKAYSRGILLAIIAGFMMLGGIKYFRQD